MVLLSVIRRWTFRDRIPIREISRRTGLSRNTIRKYLWSDEVEPRFKASDRPSKLDPFAEKLAHWMRVAASSEVDDYEAPLNRSQLRQLMDAKPEEPSLLAKGLAFYAGYKLSHIGK